MKIKLITFLSILSVTLFGQTPDGKKEVITIKSDIYKTDRKIAVYLPKNYEELKNEKLNVIYVLDGQFEPLPSFVFSSVSFLSTIGESNNMIIVGVYADDRPKEFVPMPESEKGIKEWQINKEFGYSALFDKHLSEEIFPLIEEKFNVTKYKIGIGHSLGGTYLINSFAENHKLFNSYIAISPNLDFENDQIQNKIEKLLKQSTEINSFVYVSVGSGDNTELNFKKGIQRLDTIFNLQKNAGLKFKFEYLKNAKHSTSPFLSIPNALLEFANYFNQPSNNHIVELLNNKSIDFFTEFKNAYKNKSKWLGYEYLPSENELNDKAYLCLNNNQPKKSVEIINWAIEMYPNGFNLYDSKAEFLESMNENKEAEKVLKYAIDRLEKSKGEISSYDYFKKTLGNHLKENKNSH
nr:alpha/beta hydrolase-fold protein [uncultured Flavobacterium sp.]